MRRPKKPPSASQIFAHFDEALAQRAGEPTVRDLVDRANDEAWNYEECGYRAPAGLNRDQFWCLVRLSRYTGRETVPLRDTAGRPFTYRLPAAADRVLHLADKEMAGSIASSTPELESPESRTRFVVRSLTEEAIASSLLEGAAVTREDARRMLRDGRPPH